MKISKIIFAVATISIYLLVSCKEAPSKKGDETVPTTEEHGHEHGNDDSHKHEETIKQEEFTVAKDTLDIKAESDTHKHNDGSDHKSH